jgi:hypothetical protein
MPDDVALMGVDDIFAARVAGNAVRNCEAPGERLQLSVGAESKGG